MLSKKIKFIIPMIILIIFMMFSDLTNSAYAEELPDEYITNSNNTSGGSIGFAELDSRWWILCCQHGKGIYDYSFTRNGNWKKYNYGSSYGNVSTSVAIPQEAYILNFGEDNYSDASEVQNAWWNTPAGSIGESGKDNSLSLTAKAYQKFVSRISKNATDTSTFVTEKYCGDQLDDDNISIKFPEVDESKIMVTFNEVEKISNSYSIKYTGNNYYRNIDINYDNDEQKYIVGPFSIHYEEASYGDVDFGYINNYTIFDQNENEISKDNWEFFWIKGERDANDDYQYPHSDEVFYIKVNYDTEITAISKTLIDYKYLVAGGEYVKLKGSADVDEYTYYVYKNDEGKVIGGSWVLTSSYSLSSQQLCTIKKAARWYKSVTTETSSKDISGKLSITKKTIDENGNELSSEKIQEIFGEKQYFKFKVNVYGTTSGNEEMDVVVEAGGTTTVGPFVWDKDGNAPTYTVSEYDVETGAWKLVTIKNQSNNLQKNTAVVVEATNQLNINNANLKIKKTFSQTPNIGEKYVFEIAVAGVTGKDESSIKESTHILNAEFIINSNSKELEWTSDTFYWYGDNAPTYTITEKKVYYNNNGNWVDISNKYNSVINKTSGNLNDDNGKTIEITALNYSNVTDYKGGISLSKKVTQKSNVNQEFNFEIKFKNLHDRYGNDLPDVTEYATLSVNAGKLESSNVWNSNQYTWYSDQEAPVYEITEINYDESKYRSVINPQTGSLSETDNIIECIATNINYSNHIELEKHTSVATDSDEVFKFKVTVGNLYDINDNALNDQVEYVTVNVAKGQTTGVSVWSDSYEEAGTRNQSKTYDWWNTDLVPTYTVEEIETNDSAKYNPSITPSTGTLADNGTGVAINVVAVNNRKQTLKNFIEINKSITQPADEDETFTFTVEVNNNGTVTTEDATITVLKGETTGTTTWKSQEYVWTEKQSVPTYKITEKSNSKGYRCTFADSEGNTGNDSIEGKLNGEVAKIIVDATNHYYRNNINVVKVISEASDEDEEFTFKVTVGNETETAKLTVKAGALESGVWTSKLYTWNDESNVPEYKIEEIKATKNGVDITDWYTPEINPASGKLDGSSLEINVTARNILNVHQGYLILEKELTENQVSSEEFTFDVNVENNGCGLTNPESFSVKLKQGEKAGPYTYVWYGENSPKFTVTESGNGKVDSIEVSNASGVSKNGNTVTGYLTSKGEAKVNVVYTNSLEEHNGKINVVKKLTSEEKMTEDKLSAYAGEFEVKITIEGTFKYNGENIINSSKIITGTIGYNKPFETEDIYWYGKTAPTYYVEETSISDGWQLKSIKYENGKDATNQDKGFYLVDKENLVTVTNFLPFTEYIDLTFSMGGIAWVDQVLDEKNTDPYYSSNSNGVYDKGEELKENVEVYIYEVNSNGERGNLATAYYDDNNSQVIFPILTKADGSWNVPRVKVPTGNAVTYDVEFVYDGQTYDSVAFLAEASGNASTYINGKKSTRKELYDNSMAVETVNNTNNISDVYGNTAIDANGVTNGYVNYNGEKVAVTYKSSNVGTEYPTISKLVTTNEAGVALDIFQAKASTKAGGLTFPFDFANYDGSYLTGTTSSFTINGIEKRYNFTAVYNYCLNINLGLKEREKVDIGLTKNLTTAKVIVNKKLYQYNYNTYYDLTEKKTSSLQKDIYVDNLDSQDELTLGVYSSDYYYRAEMYNTNNSRLYNSLHKFYSNMNESILNTEPDIYLTYKIKVQNNSANNQVTVNSIDDYYDSSFELVKADCYEYIEYKQVGSDGKTEDINDKILIASASDYAGNWKDVETNIISSDKDKNDANIVYNKMTAENLGITLGSGESREIILTFRVKKNVDSKNVTDSVILGLKSNVAEISNYNAGGKIDMDSAPGNVNIKELNSKLCYEDDTFAAPKINVTLKGNTEIENGITISGTVWEDNSSSENTENVKYNQNVGNGIKDINESAIEGIKATLVENVYAYDATNNEYIEFEFVWPTNDRNITGLGGHTIAELTGFNSEYSTNSEGNYEFKSVPTGIYAVRFTYGDKKLESADYSTAKYYNGQDYKSGTFKAKTVSGGITNNGYLRADTYLDIDSLNNSTQLVNTAMDNEVRRLRVANLSRELTYANTSIMSDYSNELFENYYMYAYTPKMKITDSTEEVKNLGFAIEERPITKLSLDKQIKEIKISTSDGNTIFKAVYDIAYEIDGNGDIKAKTTLIESDSYGTDKMIELNRDEATNNGFRYINIDRTILQGATITAKYQFTVLNTGEVDRTGKIADYSYDVDFVEGQDSICNNLSKAFMTYTKNGDSLVNSAEIGEYVGSVYYLGSSSSLKDNTEKEPIVTTKVRQIVDYVDNNVVFDGTLNSVNNMSWLNITTDQLKNENLIGSNVIEKNDEGNLTTDEMDQYVILDQNGINYLDGDRSNVILNADDANINSQLIVDLIPFAVNNNGCVATISLMESKYTTSELDDFAIDNIGEIVKYNNLVGRRDELSTTGNTNPQTAFEKNSFEADGTISSGMNYERDTSASEKITLSPPTGSSLYIWRIRVALGIALVLAIAIEVIISIKRKENM